MKFFTASSLGLSVLFLGLSQNPAKSFTLDAFTSFESPETSQFVETQRREPNGTTVNDEQVNLDSTVFGGSRFIQVTKNSGSEVSTVSLDVFNGDTFYGSTSNGSAEIIWQGNDSSNTPTDITIDGTTEQKSIQLDILGLDIGAGINLTLNFELKDTSDNVATISQTFTQDILSPQTIRFPYQNRVESTSDAGGNISLANIDYIKFYTSNENVGDDFSFDFLQTSQHVPFEFSPTLGIIIGSSFIGFNILRKRSKQK